MTSQKPAHTHRYWWLGVTGVHPSEPSLARNVALFFELPLLLISIWVLVRWYLGETSSLSSEFNRLYDIVLLSLFILETAVITSLVKHKARYLAENWINIAIILFGLPLLIGITLHFGALRVLRVLIVVNVLFQLSSSFRRVLFYNHLGSTLLAGLLVICLSGIVMAAIDPGIETAVDGIWWAWVTISSVGYGDIVPVTTPGKILGGLIILLGVALVTAVTANLAAFLVTQSKHQKSMEASEKVEMRGILEIEQRLENIEKRLEQLVERESPNDSSNENAKTDATR